MVWCVVPACSNYEAARKAGTSFFRFPREPEMLRKWLAAVKNDKYGVHTKYEAVKHLRVCGRHFVNSDFTGREFRLAKQLMPGQKKQPRLKSDAVPSVFAFGRQEAKKPGSVVSIMVQLAH